MSIPLLNLNSPSINPNSHQDNKLNIEVQKEEDHYFDAYSEEENFLRLLYMLKITPENGLIIDENGLPPMPPLSSSIQKAARSLLYSDQEVSDGKNTYRFHLASLINGVIPSSGIELVGGFTRQQIINDKDYILKCLQTLTGMKNLESYLSPALLSEAGRKLPDHDIRILCPEAKEAFLREKIEEVGRQITKNPNESLIKNPLFSKCRVYYEKELRYSIIALKSLRESFELMFWSRAERNFLFTADALGILVPSPFGTSEYSLKTEMGKGWQPFVDILGKVVRVPDPYQVNYMGFPKMMYHFTRSFILSDSEVLPILLAKSLKDNYDPAMQMAKLLANTCDAHNTGNPDLLTAMACNASFYLQKTLTSDNLQKFWNKLVTDSNFPLLKLIATIDKSVSVESLLTALQFSSLVAVCTNAPNQRFSIRTHAGAPAIQLFCPIKECTLLIPCSLEKLDLLVKEEVSESLLAVIEEIVFRQIESNSEIPKILKKLQMDPLSIKQKTLNLINTDQISKKYLGFLLLSALMAQEPEENYLQVLIKQLPAMAKYRNDQTAPLLKFVSKIFTGTGEHRIAQLISSYTADAVGDFNFVQGLITSKDLSFVKIASQLWKGVRSSNTRQNDLLVAASLLPYLFGAALLIYKEHLKENPDEKLPEEVQFFNQALDRASRQNETTLEKGSSLLQSLISETLIRHEGHGIELYMSSLKRFINQLINLRLFEMALEAIELTLPYVPELKTICDTLLKIALFDPKTIEHLKKKIQLLSSTPTAAQITIYWKALEAMILYKPTKALALESLGLLKTQEHERVSQIAHVKMNSLFKKNNPTSSFQKTYRGLLTPHDLQINLERLIIFHLNKKQIPEAISLWNQIFTLKDTPTTRELTNRLLESLTEMSEHLPKAYSVLRKLNGLSLITPEERVVYAVRIFDGLKGKPSMAVMLYLLETIDANLSGDARREITERVLSGLTAFNPPPEPMKQLLAKASPLLLQAAVENQWFLEADDLIDYLTPDELLSRNDSARYHEQALDHFVQKKQTGRIFERLSRVRDCIDPSPFRRLILSIQPRINPQNQARLLLENVDELENEMGFELLQQLIFSVIFQKDISEKTTLALFEKSPPKTLATWKIVFSEASRSFILNTWDRFKNWLQSNPSVGMGKIIRDLGVKMNGHRDWFMDLKREVLNLESPLSHHCLKEKEALGGISLSIMRALKTYEDERVELMTLYSRSPIVLDPKVISEWLDFLIQTGTSKGDQEAIKLLTLALTSCKDTAPLVEAADRLINALVDSDLDLMELYITLTKNLPLLSLLWLAERQMKNGVPTSACVSLTQPLIHMNFSNLESQNDELMIRRANLIGPCIINNMASFARHTTQPDVILDILMLRYPIIKISKQASKQWLNYAAEQLVQMLLDPKTAPLFDKTLLKCTRVFTGPLMDQIIIEDKLPVPTTIIQLIIPYPRRFVKVPAFIEWEKSLFSWTTKILHKVLLAPKNEHISDQWYQFASQTLFFLIYRFQEKKKPVLLKLVQELVYAIPPDHDNFATHLTDCTEFFHETQSVMGVFEYLEPLLYVNQAKIPLPSTYLNLLPLVIKKTLKFNSVEAIIHAIEIINNQLSFSFFIMDPFIESCELLFDQIPSFSGLYKIIQDKLFYTENFVNFLKINPSYPTHVYLGFVEKILDVYKRDKDKSVLIDLIEILVESIEDKAFLCLRGKEWYPQLLKKLKMEVDAIEDKDITAKFDALVLKRKLG